MKLIKDNEALYVDTVRTSSTLSSTAITIDRAIGFAMTATSTSSVPTAVTFASGLKEVFTITSPAENGAKEVTEITVPAENAVKEVTSFTFPAENAVKEVTTVQTLAGSAITTGQYFNISTALDAILHYVWFNKDGGGGDPAPGGGRIAVPVAILAADTATQVAVKVAAALDALPGYVVPVPGTDTMTVTRASTGASTDAADVDSGSTIITTVVGVTSVYNSKCFNISTALDGILHYVWFNTNGEGTDPAPVGRTAIPITNAIGATAESIAIAVAAALDALPGYVAPVPGAAIVQVTNARTGNTTDAANGAAAIGAGFSLNVDTQGVTSVYNGKYFTINSAFDAIAYYVWFNTNSEGTDPAPASKTAIPIVTTIGQSANSIADAVAAALDALAAFVAPNPAAAVITCTNAITGATTNAANVDVGAGFSIAITGAGATSVLNNKYFTIDTAVGYPTATTPYYVWFNTNSEGVDPAVAGKTAVPVATAIGDTDAQVATKVSAAIDALTGFVCPDTGAATSIVTNFDAGTATDAANVNVGTGFSISIGTQGTESKVDLINDKIKVTAHGLLTGLKVQVTTSSALPTGIAGTTDYFVIKIDADVIQLASSLANALAGSALNITAIGTGTQTITPLVGGIIGTVKLQASLDNSTYFDVSGSSQNIAGAGTYMWNVSDAFYKWIRVQTNITNGEATMDARITVKTNDILA